MTKIFIDGQEGTTGLKIFERFKDRTDLEILRIDEERRKDLGERKRLINTSDFTFLCLPDKAAVEAVELVDNPNVRIIDASTAHRTNPDWAYGFPELSAEHRKKIRTSNRVAVPGCYAGGFISIVYPLVANGFIAPDYPLTCYALSGYSGAGKKAIAVYEGEDKPYEFNSPRQYALTQQHKHLPEMQSICGLAEKPIFIPVVCDYYSGMVVTVPLFPKLMKKRYTPDEIVEMLKKHYKDQPMVKVCEFMAADELPDGFLPANTLSGKNYIEIFVYGNEDRIVLSSRLDNLGKGASGAAVQCLNIMLGIDETEGLL
ncbi:MAG: N-acetyl-gamma-glutamyl-phosphate reductase [Firmicutes bacterium]|nr:N-acetyl-gamma-glutamyl-phosphate reductase [[Eubacterium] siraeum]MCM1487588.1 N-acetyl-gamma-glutamyl-phosphate reductase [Bacillota bacterium]